MSALALLLAAMASPSFAPASPQGPELVAVTDADDLAADRRRVLVLEDGTALRGRSRLVDGRWERRVDRDWTPVEGVVVRARLEKDAEAEARRRSSDLGREATDERVALAHWMIGEGLHAEALRELDRVLASDAEHAGALALLRAAPLELDLDLAPDARPGEVLVEYLKRGARGTPAEREVAVARVADFAQRVNLRELIDAELARPQPSRRAFATLLAKRLYRGEMVPELARRALLDPMGDVRHGAALALRTANSPTVVGPLASGLTSQHHAVRVRATEALGLSAQPAAVAPLMASLSALQAGGPSVGVRGHFLAGTQIALVTDYDVEIAQAASIGDPIVSIQDSGVIHDVRAQAQINRRIELEVTVAALRDVTGRAEASPEAWLEWWKANGATWPQAAQPASSGSGRTTAPR